MYQAMVFKHNSIDMIKLFADVMLRPQISNDEVAETRQSIFFELEDSMQKHDYVITELAHRTAFKNTYGLPQHCSEESLVHLNRDNIMAYRERFFQPHNIVVAGVGLEHDMLVSIAQDTFGGMQPSIRKDGRLTRPDPEYVGGIAHRPAPPPQPHLPPSPFTHFMLAYKALSYTHPDIYALSVLQVLLGGGDSFSAGGPGKGMYSHFYARVLNRYHWVDKIQAQIFPYATSGLFGIHCAVPPNGIAWMLEVIAGELQSILQKGISDEELERAKNQLRVQVMMNLEGRIVALEDIGRQVQVKGFRTHPWEMSEKVDAVTKVSYFLDPLHLLSYFTIYIVYWFT